jgi:hypothetical protein
MAASFDTHQLFTGKSGAAVTAMTCAAAIFSVNTRTLFALAGGCAP